MYVHIAHNSQCDWLMIWSKPEGAPNTKVALSEFIVPMCHRVGRLPYSEKFSLVQIFGYAAKKPTE